MNEIEWTVSGSRSTSGDGDALVTVPGAFRAQIDGIELIPADPGVDVIKVELKSGSRVLRTVQLNMNAVGFVSTVPVVGDVDGEVYLALDDDVTVYYTLSGHFRQ